MPHRPPQLTPASRLLTKAAGAAERWRPLTRWAVALVALVAVLTVDALTGSQVNLLFLYLLIAGFAAWTLGERNGLIFALLVAFFAAAIRHFQYAVSPHPITLGAEAWNAVARLLSAGLVVTLVSGMRTALQLERWRASTDGLTGALNKASFHDGMLASIAAGRSRDRAFLLCYMDLDGFKQVNDRYGHSAGDDILRIFAEGAIDAIREGDLFARIGGDEFIALLSIPSLDDGEGIAALVHRRLSDVLARSNLKVSCSMGALVATASQIEPLEVAIQLADSLMYDVKRAGKNALRVARIDPTKAPASLDCLRIQSDMDASSTSHKRSGVMRDDRRVS